MKTFLSVGELIGSNISYGYGTAIFLMVTTRCIIRIKSRFGGVIIFTWSGITLCILFFMINMRMT